MRRFATFVAVFVVLLSGSAPILACMTGESMSASESACCRSMHGDCGAMAKTGCCRVAAGSEGQPPAATSATSVEGPAILAAPVWIAVALRLTPAVSILKMPDEYSPPGLIVVRISNLRI